MLNKNGVSPPTICLASTTVGLSTTTIREIRTTVAIDIVDRIHRQALGCGDYVVARILFLHIKSEF
jgi:hypothetical protein